MTKVRYSIKGNNYEILNLVKSLTTKMQDWNEIVVDRGRCIVEVSIPSEDIPLLEFFMRGQEVTKIPTLVEVDQDDFLSILISWVETYSDCSYCPLYSSCDGHCPDNLACAEKLFDYYTVENRSE